MTASTTQTGPGSTRDEFRRILAVVRLHFTNAFPLVGRPWLIMAVVFVASLAVWWIIRTAAPDLTTAEFSQGTQFSTSSAFIFIYMLVVAVQAVNLTFPFALGFGATRRDFYLGTSAPRSCSCCAVPTTQCLLLPAYYSLGMSLLAGLENAAGGWVLGGGIFDFAFYGAAHFGQRFLLFLLVFLFFFFIGALSSSLYVRWRTNGMIGLFAGATLIVIGSALLVTLTGSWPAVGEWLARTGGFGVAAWSLLPTALAAVAGFFLLRRATPRN